MTQRRALSWLIVLGTVLAASPGWCDSPPYDTSDASIATRPELTAMVGLSHDEPGRFANLVLEFSVPLNPRAELDITPSLASAQRDGARHAGLGDTEVSVRVLAFDESGARPALAVEPSVVLPTGHRHNDLGEGLVQEAISLIASKGRLGPYRATVQVGYAHAGEDDLAPVSLLIERSIGARWRLGAEAASEQPLRRRCARRSQVDFGAAFEVRDGLTLHAVVGRNLDGDHAAFGRLALTVEL